MTSEFDEKKIDQLQAQIYLNWDLWLVDFFLIKFLTGLVIWEELYFNSPPFPNQKPMIYIPDYRGWDQSC